MIVKHNDTEYEVKIRITQYTNNKNMALLITLKDGAPFTRLTVNLDEKLPEYYAYLDTNNTPWAESFVMKYNLGQPVGKAKASGFCVYPLYHFDKDILERYTK